MGRKFLIGMVVAIVAIVLVCAFGGRLASRFAPTPTPTPLSAIGAEEPVVTAKGVIVPIRYARLGFEVSGTLVWLAVKEGEVVKAGQLLARLDTADLELAVRAAEARLAQVKAQLDRAEAGPRPEDIALAEVDLERAKIALEKAQLHAPFAGTVVSITAREWETVVLGAPIITLADLSELMVETTDLDEWGAARVKVGDAARITVNAFKDKVLTGKVVAIAKQGVTLPTGDVAYTVTIALDKQDPELRWGMTVKVEFR